MPVGGRPQEVELPQLVGRSLLEVEPPRITPVTSLESIVSALATGGILAVNGTKLTLTPFSFPEGPVRVKKFSAEPGSVPLSFIDRGDLAVGVRAVDQGVAGDTVGLVELRTLRRRVLVDLGEIGRPQRRPERLQQIFQRR